MAPHHPRQRLEQDRVSRREMLHQVAAGTALLASLQPMKVSARSVTPHGRRLYDDVLTYYRNGPHRTGSKGNMATARWLGSEVLRAGGQADLQPWTLTQFELEARELTVSGRSLDVFPLWLPKATHCSGMTAKLASMGSSSSGGLRGNIAVFEASQTSVSPRSNHGDMIARATEAGAVAVICSNRGREGSGDRVTPERILRLTQNVFAPFNQRQWAIPAATVAYRDYPTVLAAAERRAEASLTIAGRIEPERVAYNVIGRIERGTRPIVVATPYSGWLYCAGERGGGLALWLDLLRWAGCPERRASYLFVATSGHEIGHMGQDALIAEGAPAPDETHAWLHLGSGLGSYKWALENGSFVRHESGGVQVIGASQRFERLVQEHLGDLAEHYFPAGEAHGELRGGHEAGYTTFGLYGGNIFSHSAFDGPEQVSPLLLDRLSERLKTILVEVERSV